MRERRHLNPPTPTSRQAPPSSFNPEPSVSEQQFNQKQEPKYKLNSYTTPEKRNASITPYILKWGRMRTRPPPLSINKKRPPSAPNGDRTPHPPSQSQQTYSSSHRKSRPLPVRERARWVTTTKSFARGSGEVAPDI